MAVSLCTRAQNSMPQFVSFSSEPDGVSLVNATIGYSEQEYEGVKMAIENLRDDMNRVLGQKPQLQSPHQTSPRGGFRSLPLGNHISHLSPLISHLSPLTS